MNKVFLILRYCYLLIFVWCLLVSINIGKVEAVAAPPNSINVEYVRAIRSVHEPYDCLFVCRYLINYNTEPTETADQLFLFAIADAATGSIRVQRSVAEDGYGYNLQTLYLTANEMNPAHIDYKGVTWGGSYNAVIMSNPSAFMSVHFDDFFYDSSCWINSSTVSNGQTALRALIISQSRALDLDDTSLGLTINSSSGWKLTTAGVAFWEDRYSGINDFTDLYSVSSQYITVENQTYTGAYLTELSGTSGMFGSMTTVKDSFTTLGDAIGIPYWQVIAFAVLMLPSFIIISGSVYAISGNSKMAAIIAAPVMFVISMLIPDALLMILTGIVALIVVAVMWRFV